ncbi:hypothetical protein TNCV_1322781 [Trichonephila clavipes]|nr:hypothetical protein TNCV_1322781 [Trichonephila clavipes]
MNPDSISAVMVIVFVSGDPVGELLNPAFALQRYTAPTAGVMSSFRYGQPWDKWVTSIMDSCRPEFTYISSDVIAHCLMLEPCADIRVMDHAMLSKEQLFNWDEKG